MSGFDPHKPCHISPSAFLRSRQAGDALVAAGQAAAVQAVETFNAGYREGLDCALLSIRCEYVSYSAKTEEGRKTLDRLVARLERDREFGGVH